MQEPVIALSFFDWVEISSLKILDKCESQERFIIDFLYDCGDLFPSELRGCA